MKNLFNNLIYFLKFILYFYYILFSWLSFTNSYNNLKHNSKISLNLIKTAVLILYKSPPPSP